jgi:hypothetical protein
MSYSVTHDLPDNPDVRIIFDGLLWFLFHGTDECQVGIHNTTQGRSHPHPHELNVNLWTITGCNTAQPQCTLEAHSIGNPKSIAGISVDVNNSRFDGVHVFQKDDNQFDRLDDQNNHPNDWRWILDFEKEPFYPSGIKLDGTKINPSVSINHGTFYTLHLTSSKYGLLRPNNTLYTQLGRVPQYMAANIYLNTGGNVVLGIRRPLSSASEFRTLQKVPGTCYEIDIQNACFDCSFNPSSSVETARNDFYLYYDTFTQASSRPHFALKRTEAHTPQSLPPGLCFPQDARVQRKMESNNEAPCGPVGAGGGGGG